MTIQPDWDKINREISESIESKPTRPEPERLDLMKDGFVYSPQGIWKHAFGKIIWVETHDWREPAAAMELLKRMKVPYLRRCDAKWNLDDFELHASSSADTPEEAIVLAYHASLKST